MSAMKQNSQLNTIIQVVAGILITLGMVAGSYYFIQKNLVLDAKRSAAATQQAELEAAVQQANQWSTMPEVVISADISYSATFTMEKGGQFVVQLYPDKAFLTVNSFVFLANQGYFDGTTFHRVLEGFMAQGGDPTGTGMGGPGYTFINEDSDLTFDKAGVVAMANAGRDTNGSQFFITFAPAEFLNGDYTIFGQVVSGMDVVNAITRRDPQAQPDYQGDVITSVTISEE